MSMNTCTSTQTGGYYAKIINWFKANEDRMEQCFASHIVCGCQQY